LTRPRVRGCNSALFSSGQTNETHLSAVQGTPQAYAWISRAHAHPRRPGGDTGAPRQGPDAAGRLIGGLAAGLPRSARLRSRPQFTEALAEGAAGLRRHFTVYARPNGLPHARIGIIASKRVAPRAVDRNRAKRLVREVFRAMRHRLNGTDVVVQLRRWSPRGSVAAARTDLVRLLEELAARARAS